MTITREPVHMVVPKPGPRPHATTRYVDIRVPRRRVRIDTTFWQHRSIFAGSQEQLDRLRRDAEERAAARGRAAFAELMDSMRAEGEPAALEAHRPVFKRLKPIVHVGFVPLPWMITTCRCGKRWPCNDIKQYLRRRLGWTADLTEHLKALTGQLRKPTTRWDRLRRLFTRRRGATDHGPA